MKPIFEGPFFGMTTCFFWGGSTHVFSEQFFAEPNSKTDDSYGWFSGKVRMEIISQGPGKVARGA